MRRCIRSGWGCLRIRGRSIGKFCPWLGTCIARAVLIMDPAGSATLVTSTSRSLTARIRPSVRAVRQDYSPMAISSCSRKIVGPTGLNMLVKDDLPAARCPQDSFEYILDGFVYWRFVRQLASAGT